MFVKWFLPVSCSVLPAGDHDQRRLGLRNLAVQAHLSSNLLHCGLELLLVRQGRGGRWHTTLGPV